MYRKVYHDLYHRACQTCTRPGQPAEVRRVRRKCFCRDSLGVPGALVAPLLGPWPLSRPRPSALCGSRGRDARCRSLRLRGQGLRPPAPQRTLLEARSARRSERRQAVTALRLQFVPAFFHER